MSNSSKEQKEKLLDLVRDALKHDKELRDKYEVGEKFRFIRDRLQALSTRIEESLQALHKESEKIEDTITADETLVYVYLYNTHGVSLQTWQKMLNPAVFYEYSINRPVYAEKSQVIAFIRSRANKVQHGYLTVAIKKEAVLAAGAEISKDALGHPLIKVKEGSLRPDRLISFTYNDHDFELNEEGELIKK
jgi:hypothetical protein